MPTKSKKREQSHSSKETAKKVKSSAIVDEEEMFQDVGAEAANTTARQANNIRKNQYCMLKKGQFPCKVVNVVTSKTGKHGSCKVHITGIDVFTGQKHEELFMASKDVQCPNITRHEYTASTFRKPDDFFDFGEIFVLNDQNVLMPVRIEKMNKCYQEVFDADFENKSYMVKTIKFGETEMPEMIKED